jgi:transposase
VQQLRREWLEYIPHIDVNRLIFLDETGINIGMTRLYGRAPKGERIIEYVPDVRFKRLSVVSTLRVNGDTIPHVYSGTMNGNLFTQYIAVCVVPTLNPFDILIMDCLSSHKMKIISELVEAVGANVVYLPPYSPDFNPVEPLWSEIKADLKKLKARSTEDLCDAISFSFYSVQTQHFANYFKKCFCGL